ncbi:hypothetical protein [Peterkaempfera bronchialis]|uniref:Uncharacterized protein n=1 Tax=Peterkaempfera bronchialis TaxID=2126346 RepID=A0A345SUC9_9ACTN|nr:hypothetical protein [Peterkaempfera bronchialis]AXI77334.1 hypothetical protein C7M71_007655 [Peterkaempfera bronchialis]
MNLRSLTRGDAAVAVGALLLLISSFLPLYALSTECVGSGCSQSSWHGAFLLHLASVVLAGVAGGALVLYARFQQGEAARSRQIAGLRLDQWGTALAVFATWSALWSLFTSTGEVLERGFGAYLALLSAVILAGGAVATPLVPALQAKLLPDPPAAPAPQPGGYPGPQQGGYLGGPQQGGGYGYPGAQQPGVQQPGVQQPGVQQPGAPQPGGAQAWGAPQPGPGVQQPQGASFGGPAGAPVPAPAPTPAAPPVQDFSPFWFAVPSPRPLAPEDNPVGPPIGELTPGTWFLAVEQRGAALLTRLPDGRHGLLTDTSGIERG